MSDLQPPARVTVREATPADLADVAVLLSARDGEDRVPALVAAYVWQLDPSCTKTWLAYAGTRAVGITMLYLRDMSWPAGDAAQNTIRAGYWAHLFVEPDFRKQMVYPQLVLAMIRGMAEAGLSVIFTATRQPHVAEGHQKLGFQLVGTLPVRLRPLRPFRLLAKHQGAAWLAPLLRPLDGLYHLAAGPGRAGRVRVESLDLDSPRIDEVVRLMNDRPAATVHQVWTTEVFRRRFRTTLDGEPYRITAVIKDNQLVAAMVTTMARRGNAIRACVILELLASPAATAEEVRALVTEAERRGAGDHAELMLMLGTGTVGGGGKYLATKSETYHLLVYPKTMVTAEHAAAELGHWVFSFADHDAF